MLSASSSHYAETLANASAGLTNIDTVINDHAPATMTPADLKTYSEFMKEFVAWAQAEVKTGKTPEEIAAGYKVPEKYPGTQETSPRCSVASPAKSNCCRKS